MKGTAHEKEDSRQAGESETERRRRRERRRRGHKMKERIMCNQRKERHHGN